MAAFRLPKRVWIAAALGAIAARRLLSAPFDLEGRSVLITGGSRGLGLALAREVLERGANVTLVARSGPDLQRARGLLGGGVRVQTITADLTQPGETERVVAETARHHGELDVVINNAGLIQSGPLANMTEADFRDILEINTLVPLRLTMSALPYLRARRGRVLMIASVGGKVAIPHLAPYSVSKFATTGLGQALRSELAREGIGVTTVLPGLMRTGSPRQALVKGQAGKEYALLATLDNLPLVSLDAREAARRIVNALVRGDAEAVIGGPALILRTAQALAPQLTADLMALGNRLLPGPTPRDTAVRGESVESPVTQRNPIKQRAEADFNQQGSEKEPGADEDMSLKP
ncbi:SDR family NAD(P)-dependent oxidoreductase [Deinococcus koreensis]|uniref:Ketoacyl reductase n=1 Tax=Deinococcus koreensis TaxID=2054903 RepID=A0A2K3UT31_9DEIO|nr:SDR family NAD(P)-dependent oxidoreductase [Deinococcus koreensis]PNY79689.1 ketoacyl reductase [Deinococcus koreensis]